MHKHEFCGEQSIYTSAILANQKICMPDFFVWGGTDNLWVARAPPPPDPPPVPTPLIHAPGKRRQPRPQQVRNFAPFPDHWISDSDLIDLF